MNNIRWDESAFILIAMGMVYSPALVAIPWAFFTRLQQVKKILILSIILSFSAPFFGALVFAVFMFFCDVGHLVQRFAKCGVIPDKIANFLFFISLWLPLAIAGFAAAYCVFLEIRRFRNR